MRVWPCRRAPTVRFRVDSRPNHPVIPIPEVRREEVGVVPLVTQCCPCVLVHHREKLEGGIPWAAVDISSVQPLGHLDELVQICPDYLGDAELLVDVDGRMRRPDLAPRDGV